VCGYWGGCGHVAPCDSAGFPRRRLLLIVGQVSCAAAANVAVPANWIEVAAAR
jgi:hypothetical protein